MAFPPFAKGGKGGFQHGHRKGNSFNAFPTNINNTNEEVTTWLTKFTMR